MNNLKKNTDNYLQTILFIVLAFALITFASNKKNHNTINPNSSICLFIDIHANTQAVIPASNDLPICASFTDENRIILNQSFVTDFPINIILDKEFRCAKDKHLKIKPLLNKVARRLIFACPEPSDFISIC